MLEEGPWAGRGPWAVCGAGAGESGAVCIAEAEMRPELETGGGAPRDQ